jgi:hypothetical protein
VLAPAYAANASQAPGVFRHAGCGLAGATLHGVAHILIEFLPHDVSKWEVLGRFTATEAEIDELRAVLEAHDSPYDALERLPKGLVWETLDICRQEGHDVRVSFREEDA